MNDKRIPQGWSIEPAYSGFIFGHENYCGAPDSNKKHLSGRGDSIEDCLEQIAEIENNMQLSSNSC